MSINLIKSLPELIEAGIITTETASKIEDYYQSKKGQSQNRVIIAFGILGSILVGLGIILIIAHNWDELPRFTKSLFAFLPLLIGQAACGYTILKNHDSIAWKESSSIFLFLSIGATIALLSQIYILGGTLPEFILTWMLLGLPIIYVMQSSMVSLFYLAGITYYSVIKGYWYYPTTESYTFWLLLLLALPYYYLSLRKTPVSNFMYFHHWIIPLSATISLGTIAHNNEHLMFVAYISLFGLFTLIGNLPLIKNQKNWINGYAIIGTLGTIILFFIFSFEWFWNEKVLNNQFFLKESPEFIATAILSVSAILLMFYQYNKKILSGFSPANFIFLLFIFLYLLGNSNPEISFILSNITILSIGIYNLWLGIKNDHLGILNFGLLIITCLIICRFFDSDLSFITRGILFILVGIGFFVANYQLIKKRKAKSLSNN
jgi:uncharacterized membrane protein